MVLGRSRAPDLLPFYCEQARHSLSSAYTDALDLYWQGRDNEALDQISQVLADQPDHPDQLELYRLWIEILADEQDEAALRYLIAHLLLRGESDDDLRATYLALRGLIHLELDEIDGVELILSCLHQAPRTPYLAELRDRFGLRQQSAMPTHLWSYTEPVRDYFHLTTLAQLGIAYGRDDVLIPAMHVLDAAYPGNDFSSAVRLHRSLAAEDWENACQQATMLTQAFPERRDYRYWRALSLLESGATGTALSEARSLLAEPDERQADIHLLIARALEVLGVDEHRSEIVDHLRKAVELGQMAGLPVSQAALHADQLERHDEDIGLSIGDSLDDLRPPRLWLKQLSANGYAAFAARTSEERGLFFTSLGPDARAGDMCFLAVAAEDDEGRTIWQIRGVYLVKSDALRHPYQGFQSAVERITECAEPINLDVQMTDEPQAGKEHPAQSGVFEVGQGALEVINAAARQQNEAREALDDDDASDSSTA